jgi:hypothetical protein
LHWPKVITFNPPTFWALILPVVNVTRFRLDPSNKVTAARLKPKYFGVIPITFVSRPNLITRSIRARHRHPPFGGSKAFGLTKLGHLKIVIRTKGSELGHYHRLPGVPRRDYVLGVLEDLRTERATCLGFLRCRRSPLATLRLLKPMAGSSPKDR